MDEATTKPASIWLRMAAHFSWQSTVLAVAMRLFGPQFRDQPWLHQLVQNEGPHFLAVAGIVCAMGVIIAVVMGYDRRLLAPALFGVILDVLLAGVILVMSLAGADPPD